MTFFLKLALSLLGNEIDEMILDMHHSSSSSFSFSNRGLIAAKLDATHRFRETIARSFQSNDASDDASILDSLSNSISEFQAKINALNESYDTHGYRSYTEKLELLLRLIRKECVATEVWRVDYNDSDPFCIFQYNLISYIISKQVSKRSNTGFLLFIDNDPIEQTIKMIRDEIKTIKDIYPRSFSKTSFNMCNFKQNVWAIAIFRSFYTIYRKRT
ncbi:hypothetical protein [Legionella sainthelensi]|uniref:Uncharacterized protein n=1 Tax=Legionella sainthelensi TaxID=28087 RepID=A0A2H5FNE1_9GAMM|nr:hypothetical protein [Legionella sainthelensi]AUH73087.1 hypothetical protein CAB17_14295 [Legionella sainthelensi]